ncbi:hypothetical protein ACFQ60_08430 [Streptomyces zhihengii]
MFLGLLGLFAGAISATGATASACGTQVLIAAVIGAGMDLPEPAWLRGLSYLTGAAWPLLLRRLVPGPRRRGPAPYRLDGEHAALAAVYERTAALLAAAGDPAAAARRTALTAALDHAQDVLARTRSGPRASRAERGLHARYGAAAALAEAATALAWTGSPCRSARSAAQSASRPPPVPAAPAALSRHPRAPPPVCAPSTTRCSAPRRPSTRRRPRPPPPAAPRGPVASPPRRPHGPAPRPAPGRPATGGGLRRGGPVARQGLTAVPVAARRPGCCAGRVLRRGGAVTRQGLTAVPVAAGRPGHRVGPVLRRR